MALDPALSGARNVTQTSADLYVTADSSASPLHIAARTSGPFTAKQQVIDAATAGDIDADNWGEIIASPVVGENIKPLAGLPAATPYYYGFVQEPPGPAYDFEPTGTVPANAQPVSAAPLTSSATPGPTGLTCWDATNAQTADGAGSVNWIARNNYQGRLTANGVPYGNKQTFLFKRDPSKTQANLHAWVALAQMGMGYAWNETLYSIDLTTGDLKDGDFFSFSDDVRFSGGIYDGGDWVWLTVEFTVANGHSFANADQIVFGLCSTPGSRFVAITEIGAGGFHVSDAVNI